MTARTAAIVLARTSSSRLPSKACLPLGGVPLLEVVLTRLVKSLPRSIPVALATSDTADDDRLEATAERLGVPCHRGPLADVLQRFLIAAAAEQIDSAFRVNGDSPFVPVHRFVDALQLQRRSGADVVTNVFPERTGPPGAALELVRVGALESLAAGPTQPDEREHVTLGLYRRPEQFQIEPCSWRDFGDPDTPLAVDHAADLDLMNLALAHTPTPAWKISTTEASALIQDQRRRCT